MADGDDADFSPAEAVIIEARMAALHEVARALESAEFEMTCRRMASHSLELMPDGMSDDELDAEAARLTKAALKR